MCRLLGVSPSGYYAWRRRPPSRRQREDAELLGRIEGIWEASGRVYGAPRVWAELRAAGVRCSRKPLSELMLWSEGDAYGNALRDEVASGIRRYQP